MKRIKDKMKIKYKRYHITSLNEIDHNLTKEKELK